MPSYKNELTHQIILDRFKQKYLSQINTISSEELYQVCCSLLNDNKIHKRQPKWLFDRQIFDQLIEQCPQIQRQQHEQSKSRYRDQKEFKIDPATVNHHQLQDSSRINQTPSIRRQKIIKIENFIYNIMRAQILINEKLKQIHLSIQDIQDQIEGKTTSRAIPTHSNSNGNDSNNDSIAEQLFELKELKAQFDEDLYAIRSVFIPQDTLNNLVKTLAQSRSNNNLHPLKSEHTNINQNLSTLKNQSHHNISSSRHIQHHQNSPVGHSPSINNNSRYNVPGYQNQQDNNNPNFPMTLSRLQRIKHSLNLSTQLNLKLVFILLSFITLLQLPITLFYNSYTNLMVFGIISTMYIVEYYNKIIIQFFCVLVWWSILIDIIWYMVNFKFFISPLAFDSLVGVGGFGNEIPKLNALVYVMLALLILVTIGKVLIGILLLFEIDVQEVNDVEIDAFWGLVDIKLKVLESGDSLREEQEAFFNGNYQSKENTPLHSTVNRAAEKLAKAKDHKDDDQGYTHNVMRKNDPSGGGFDGNNFVG